MTFLKKKPVYLALLLGLVAISSFAVSYNVLTSSQLTNAPSVDCTASTKAAVLGGSCCSSEAEAKAIQTAVADTEACSLEKAAACGVTAQTVAAKEETAGSCCATMDAQVAQAACSFEKTTNSADTSDTSQTKVAAAQ